MSETEPTATAYEAIFFDMDGTLLPMEVRDFIIPYYRLLAEAAARAGYNPQAVQDSLNAGILEMMGHPSGETNATAFWRVFYDQLFEGGQPASQERERIEAFFADFYANDFGKAGEGVSPNPAARAALETLAAKGYPLYLTTMPLFPYDAIRWRTGWADFDIGLFSRVTTYDNSTSSKPNVSYFEENVALAGVPANRVLVVGNNTADDMNARLAGCDVYLVTDYLINENGFDVDTVKHGSLAQFAQWAESFPACTSTTALGWRERASQLTLGEQ